MKLKSVILALVVFLPFMVLAHGGNDSAGSDEAVEELEMIEEVEEVAESDQQPATLADYLGSLHPAVIHFPIAWMVLFLLVELINIFRREWHWHRLGGYLLILTVVSFVPAVLTGWVQGAQVSFNEPYASIFELHRNLNFLTAALSLGALMLRRKQPSGKFTMKQIIYWMLILGAGTLVLYSGHLGGRLVHG